METKDKTLDEKIAESNAIIEKAFKRYGKLGIAFSGGTDSLVLLKLVYPYRKDIPVILVDTQDEFPKTLKFVDKTVKEMNLNFHTYKAEENRHKEFRKKFKDDKAAFIETCCNYHKISPLLAGVKDLELDALFVGIRASEHEERRKAGIFEPKTGHYRVHPLHAWTIFDILNFVNQYGIECNPLYSEGFVSLGCQFCTEKSPVLMERGGRDKTRESIMKALRSAGYT